MSPVRTLYFVIDTLKAKTSSTAAPSAPAQSFIGENCLCNTNKCCCCTNAIGGNSPMMMADEPILYDTIRIEFPNDFIQSINNKFINVITAKYYNYQKGAISDMASISSDVCQDTNYDDSFLCLCGESEYNKRLQIYDARTQFTLWVKNVYGNIIDLDPAKTRIFVELLLEY
jgi:hypothetical protein